MGLLARQAGARSGHSPADAQIDSRTLKDIGVEPGSITWL